MTILQIVPRVPGGLDGVGDYALNLAIKFRDKFGCGTIFGVPEKMLALNAAANSRSVLGFDLVALEHLVKQPFSESAAPGFNQVVLHYVNYGYHKRGTPFGLLSILRDLHRQRRAKLLTVFHELYASAPPWKSAFWLRPLQVYLARAIARLSDECLVSSEVFLRKLQRLAPTVPVHLHPVPSGFGEPNLSHEQIVNRDPRHWGIVGGTVLAERSLRSFVENMANIPESIAPKKLSVVGGDDNPATRSLLSDMPIESEYKPRASVSQASEILRNCGFGWLNYFHRSDVEGSVALKSTAFGALCGHAIVPIFPHRCSAISIDGDALPGPFFVEPESAKIPTPQERADVATSFYNWYQRHAASQHLAEKIAEVLGLAEAGLES